MSGFQQTTSTQDCNCSPSFNSSETHNPSNHGNAFPTEVPKEKKDNQIQIKKAKELIIVQGISIFISFISSFFIGNNTYLSIMIAYGLITLSISFSIYKGIQLSPFFFEKIGHGFYPLLIILLIGPILSGSSIVSWNPLNWFKLFTYQPFGVNSNYILLSYICIYYNDVYKIIYLFHILFLLIGSNHLLFTSYNSTTSMTQTLSKKKSVIGDLYTVKGFFKNTLAGNGNPNQYVLSDFQSNLSELSENNFNYYKAKRANDKMKNKSNELDLFFVENLSTCHEVISLNNQLIVNHKTNKTDLPLFEAIGWQIYEPKSMAESDTSYDELISIFIRPKQEKDLQQKINALIQTEEIDTEAETAEEEDPEMINEKTEEILMKEHYELGIIRTFHSIPNEDEKTTVIVRDVNDPYYKIYSKGPIEDIISLCKKDTIPNELNETIKEYQSNKDKYTVIGLSAKMIKMSYSQSQEAKRAFLETNMIFLGVVVVEKNKGSNKEQLL